MIPIAIAMFYWENGVIFDINSKFNSSLQMNVPWIQEQWTQTSIKDPGLPVWNRIHLYYVYGALK